MTVDEQFWAMRSALAAYLPALCERLALARPTDEKAGLAGCINPVVRHAVGRLTSGYLVIVLGDVVVLNDPLRGQRTNNAAKVADLFLDVISRLGDRPFDQVWLEGLAAAEWRRVRAATFWTNSSLLPQSPHLADLMRRTTRDQAITDRFAHGFDQPDTILPLLLGRETE
jgi:hypothetical protein